MSEQEFTDLNVVALAGGVGGAKLVDGLAEIIPSDNLTVVVNTGDDFEHLGLRVCPDLDTVMYTLAAVANNETGWGRTGESWRTIEEVGRLGGPDWFRLGDLDLATHLTRTHLLSQGSSLTKATRHLCRQLGIRVDVVPMSNQPAPTVIETADGMLPFQTWFVREQWQPVLRRIHLPEEAKASPAAMACLEAADIVVIAPSNPFVSVAPILNMYPLREMIMDLPQAVVAVSPIIGGQAVKGPAAKMMAELEMPVTARAVAEYYGDLIDGFVYDRADEGSLEGLKIGTLCTDTWMRDRGDRIRLAREVMHLALSVAQA